MYRVGSLAWFRPRADQFRNALKSRYSLALQYRSKRATKRQSASQQNRPLFNHLVGDGKNPGRDGETKSPDAHSSGHLVAGDAQVRIGPLDRPAVAQQILPKVQFVPSPSCVHPTSNTIAASAPIQTTHASRPGQIPIVCTAPPAHHRPRFRAMALFGRRPIERVAANVFTGIQKPAHQHTSGSRSAHADKST